MPAKKRICLLFDNGSVRPASTLHLREMALATSTGLFCPVHAVSLLHSDKIAASALDGAPAILLEQSLRIFWQAHPDGEALLVPAFFGPSRALTHYVPQRLRALAADFPRARWQLAPCLVDLQNPRDTGCDAVAGALAEEACRTIAAYDLNSPAAKILLVDHGSPECAVSAVRDRLAEAVRELLRGKVAHIGAASMERRTGEKYAFNEPLLERALRAPPFDSGDVIVLLQFLSPGRHAGPGGDIATLCKTATAERPGLRARLSDVIGSHPQIVGLLRRRFEDLLAK